MTVQIQIDFNAGGGVTDTERRVLSLISRGREKAISMAALAATLDISTRDLQNVVKHLIEDHGVLIASATGKGKGDTKRHGYYYPENEEEFRAAAAQLEHRIISLAKRLRAINKESYEEIFGQGRLLEEVKQ